MKINFKERKGITLVALVITIIILIILAGITISQLTGSGLFTKAKQAKEEEQKAQATEKINLKITNMQISSWIENEEMPTLQYVADKLCEDNDMEYVTLASKTTASLDKVTVPEGKSIYTKLKEYNYEFEINDELRIASINGVKVANTTEIPDGYIKTPTETINITENGEYDVTNYASANININTYLPNSCLKITEQNSKIDVSSYQFVDTSELIGEEWSHGVYTYPSDGSNLTVTLGYNPKALYAEMSTKDGSTFEYFGINKVGKFWGYNNSTSIISDWSAYNAFTSNGYLCHDLDSYFYGATIEIWTMK